MSELLPHFHSETIGDVNIHTLKYPCTHSFSFLDRGRRLILDISFCLDGSYPNFFDESHFDTESCDEVEYPVSDGEELMDFAIKYLFNNTDYDLDWLRSFYRGGLSAHQLLELISFNDV